MTHDELVELTRRHMRNAFGDLGTDEDPPYGMSIAEANAAMSRGIALAVSDFIVAAAKPTEYNRRVAASIFADIFVSEVERASTKGSC